jgi:hypothetical protein
MPISAELNAGQESKPGRNPSASFTFEDACGMNWNVEVSASIIRAIRNRTGYVLIDLEVDEKAEKSADESWEKLIRSYTGLVEVLFAVVEKQAMERGITFQDFADRFDLSTLLTASCALQGALVVFSRPSDLDNRARIASMECANELRARWHYAAREAIDGMDSSTNRLSDPCPNG